MKNFVLVSARKSRGGEWSHDDYDVRDSHGKLVGRSVFHRPCSDWRGGRWGRCRPGFYRDEGWLKMYAYSSEPCAHKNKKIGPRFYGDRRLVTL
jgi:hypothetical protein